MKGDGLGARTLSTAVHVAGRGKPGGPPSKAQHTTGPIAHQYREGTVKSTPARGMKQSLKPRAHSRSEPGSPGDGVLFVERAGELRLGGKAKGDTPGAGAKASPKRAISRREQTRNWVSYP